MVSGVCWDPGKLQSLFPIHKSRWFEFLAFLPLADLCAMFVNINSENFYHKLEVERHPWEDVLGLVLLFVLIFWMGWQFWLPVLQCPVVVSCNPSLLASICKVSEEFLGNHGWKYLISGCLPLRNSFLVFVLFWSWQRKCILKYFNQCLNSSGFRNWYCCRRGGCNKVGMCENQTSSAPHRE